MVHFTHVKVFSATKLAERNELGEVITRWIKDHPEADIVDKEVRLSSDDQFHCLTITLFYCISAAPAAAAAR